jgi:hypothetical protein
VGAGRLRKGEAAERGEDWVQPLLRTQPLQTPGRTRPFAEFRWTWVNDTSPFRLVVGFNYRLR